MNSKRFLAALINAVLSLLSIVLALTTLIQFGSDIPADQPPFAVFVIGLGLGVLGLLGSYGLWKHRRWGFVLTIVVRAVDGLTALPGLFFADSTWLLFWAILSVVGALLVIGLLILAHREERTQIPTV